MKHTTRPTSEAKIIARKIRTYWVGLADAYKYTSSIVGVAQSAEKEICKVLDKLEDTELFSEEDMNYLQRVSDVFEEFFIHRSKQISREAAANNFQIQTNQSTQSNNETGTTQASQEGRIFPPLIFRNRARLG